MDFKRKGYNSNMDEAKQKEYIDALTSMGSVTRPLHITPHTWDEETRRLEDHIRDSVPFEGKWESYLSGYRLVIPEELRPLLEAGGVLTVSTDDHLLLFGHRHWARYNRLLTKAVGLSPVLNSAARHTFGNMYRFNSLNEDGSIDIPVELADYAGLIEKVAIIGVVYHAEVHDKSSYTNKEGTKARETLLERFKKIRFN